MEYLECDRCGIRFFDEESVTMSKKQADIWAEMCRQDGDTARGLIACPTITCPGELILKEVGGKEMDRSFKVGDIVQAKGKEFEIVEFRDSLDGDILWRVQENKRGGKLSTLWESEFQR